MRTCFGLSLLIAISFATAAAQTPAPTSSVSQRRGRLLLPLGTSTPNPTAVPSATVTPAPVKSPAIMEEPTAIPWPTPTSPPHRTAEKPKSQLQNASPHKSEPMPSAKASPKPSLAKTPTATPKPKPSPTLSPARTPKPKPSPTLSPARTPGPKPVWKIKRGTQRKAGSPSPGTYIAHPPF